ncbi:MAG TPA: alpha/beta fold hydrolase [Marmoricola sp.]|nr:alpha/beta fold hydrolase [Marmoricola sp.]
MNSPMGAFLRPEGYAGPSGLRALTREGSAVVEAARYYRRSRIDRRARAVLPHVGAHYRPPHEPVLLVPGFMAGDYTLTFLHRMLRADGYRSYRSHIAVNAGCTREVAALLEKRIESIAIRRERKVTVVGHSLGGMLARGLAARRPDLVHGIVAMGSPVIAPGAVHRLLAWDADLLTRLARAGVRGLMGEDCIAGECAQASFDETHQPLDPGVEFTAIYSRRDGIVDWRACLDPAATAVEVATSHLGMAFDPRVYDVLRAALAEQQVSRANRREGRSGAERLRPAVNT